MFRAGGWFWYRCSVLCYYTIIYYIIHILYIILYISYTILFFCSVLLFFCSPHVLPPPSSPLSFLLLFSYHSHPHSFYTCRYLHILIYTILLFPLPISPLPYLPISPFIPSFPFLFISSQYSFYTCRYLHILIYILSQYSRLIQIRPRTNYRRDVSSGGWFY